MQDIIRIYILGHLISENHELEQKMRELCDILIVRNITGDLYHSNDDLNPKQSSAGEGRGETAQPLSGAQIYEQLRQALRSNVLGYIEGEIRNSVHRPKILLYALDMFIKDIIPLIKNKTNEKTNLPYLPIVLPSSVGGDIMHVIGKESYSINQYFEAYLHNLNAYANSNLSNHLSIYTREENTICIPFRIATSDEEMSLHKIEYSMDLLEGLRLSMEYIIY